MKWALMVDGGKRKGTIIPIRTSPFAMGRDDDCHLRAANPYVSHHHCELRTESDKFIIRDCHSTNGTFINSQKIEGEVELHEGDRLKIGSLTFRICQGDQGGMASQPPDEQPEQESAPEPRRKVDDESIGDMLLDLDDEESGPPAGAWRIASSPDAGSERGPARKSEFKAKVAGRPKDSSAPDFASKMLQGKDTSWIKPKP